MLEVYRGYLITALTVDDDQSILYLSETGKNRLVKINYSPEKLIAAASNVGKITYIYENPG